ncbi:SH3 beta-barrel fold-containing protein [Bacteroides fluxus]|uniref:SH3 beta-barrel fold-containing protein n=1 Tax=Bacteroides fluxus TaxID=626930 RepID=UPI002A8025A4|nr:SH3 beta-barrel fold-containing protein [Bacteroides fluxus]MDY3790066.1 SH3 beta-barrel fold-containing protein [Bacteroides fluxus]
MSNAFRSQISEVVCLAWQMVKRNGCSMSEALKTAWMNIKLKAAMKERIVKFYFQKVDGSIREAYGTLKDSLLPDSKGTDSRKKSDTVQTYFDTERGEYRCYKVANLVKIA